jgi:type II secretory pathway component GspD/PulD (secretin)
MMKIIVLLLLLFQLSNATDFINKSIKDFVKIVKDEFDMTILYPDELDGKVHLYLEQRPNKEIYLLTLKDALHLEGYYLKKKRGYHLILKIPKEPKILHYYKLKTMNNETIKLLESVFKGVTFTHFKQQNLLQYLSTENQHNQIQSALKEIESVSSQLSARVIIFQTNVNEIQKLGIETGYLGKAALGSDYFINLLTATASPSNIVGATQANSFFSFVNALDRNGTSKVLYDPMVLVNNHETALFEVVDNIKRVTTETTFQSANQQNTTNFTYEDVGLVLSIKPQILDEYVYLDLDLRIEDVVGVADDQIISKKKLKNKFHVRKGEVVVLSGFRKDSEQKSVSRIPWLADIPYIGTMFETTEIVDTQTVLTIAIQIQEIAPTDDGEFRTDGRLGEAPLYTYKKVFADAK